MKLYCLHVSIEMSEALKTAQEAMNNCTKAVNLVTAQIASNQALIDNYNNIRIPEYNARKDAWNKNKTERQIAQQQWDEKKNQLFDQYKKEDFYQNCGVLGPGNSGRCDGDFYEHRRDCCSRGVFGECWTEKKICRRTDGKCDSDAREQTRRERGDRPGDWVEPAPDAPAPPQQNATPVNVTCCANIQNIVASQISDARLSQENNCKSQLQKNLESARSAANNPTSIASNTKQNSALDAELRKKIIIAAIILAVLALSCSSIISLGL